MATSRTQASSRRRSDPRRHSSARNGELRIRPLFRRSQSPQLFRSQPAAPSGGITEGDVMSRIPPVDPTTAAARPASCSRACRRASARPRTSTASSRSRLLRSRECSASPERSRGAGSVRGCASRSRSPWPRRTPATTASPRTPRSGGGSSSPTRSSPSHGRVAPRIRATRRRCGSPGASSSGAAASTTPTSRRCAAPASTTGRVVEIVANTVLNVFTNYLNQIAETEIDFPVVRASAAKAA